MEDYEIRCKEKNIDLVYRERGGLVKADIQR